MVMNNSNGGERVKLMNKLTRRPRATSENRTTLTSLEKLLTIIIKIIL